MIYVCNICGYEILPLKTNGDGVNKDFVCADCAKEIQGLLKEAKKIQVSFLELLDKS